MGASGPSCRTAREWAQHETGQVCLTRPHGAAAHELSCSLLGLCLPACSMRWVGSASPGLVPIWPGPCSGTPVNGLGPLSTQHLSDHPHGRLPRPQKTWTPVCVLHWLSGTSSECGSQRHAGLRARKAHARAVIPSRTCPKGTPAGSRASTEGQARHGPGPEGGLCSLFKPQIAQRHGWDQRKFIVMRDQSRAPRNGPCASRKDRYLDQELSLR